ncbi:hypothetical protein ABZ671_01705 [Micromonospora sp. NPDC006766]|uniref:hypothetical protein n=1 Tax=Micromonospora sp. NPDC006766 TaxID=3154778 RepID=UPI0033C9F1FA
MMEVVPGLGWTQATIEELQHLLPYVETIVLAPVRAAPLPMVGCGWSGRHAIGLSDPDGEQYRIGPEIFDGIAADFDRRGKCSSANVSITVDMVGPKCEARCVIREAWVAIAPFAALPEIVDSPVGLTNTASIDEPQRLALPGHDDVAASWQPTPVTQSWPPGRS